MTYGEVGWLAHAFTAVVKDHDGLPRCQYKCGASGLLVRQTRQYMRGASGVRAHVTPSTIKSDARSIMKVYAIISSATGRRAQGRRLKDFCPDHSSNNGPRLTVSTPRRDAAGVRLRCVNE